MTHVPPTQISDELLSAYLDAQISEAERRRVEQALAADAALQRRLHALESTVRLLRQMQQAPLPRAFVLSEAQVVAAGGRVRGMPRQTLWSRLFSLLPQAMPLATAAVAVLLVVALGYDLWAGPLAAPRAAEQISALAVEAPAAAPLPPADAAQVQLERAPAPTAETAEAEIMTMQVVEDEATLKTRIDEEAESEAVAREAAGMGDTVALEPPDAEADLAFSALAESPEPAPAEQGVRSLAGVSLRSLQFALAALLALMLALTLWLRRRLPAA